MEYDPLQPGAYAEHLGEVNKSNDVIVSEDIHNAKGILIAKKGQHISHETAQKIIQFKLVKPLEESVEIADSLTIDKVVENIRELFSDDYSGEAHRRHQLSAEIRRGMQLLERYPLLRQKLTVLAVRMPHEYKKSLMVAWFSLLVARQLKMSQQERDELLVAALTHDIGMLHIERRIIDKKDQLTPDDWRALQGHVAVSSAIVRQIAGLAPSISRAVLEHHEIADGTGYLSGRRGEELSLMGQIISVVDAMCAVLIKWQPQGRNARDLIPILRVNSYIYDRKVCSAFIQALMDINYREIDWVKDDQIESFAEALLRDRDSLSEFMARIAELLKLLPSDHGKMKSINAVFVVFRHINSLVHSSGMLDDGYAQWLRKVASERQRNLYRHVEDTRLMLDELYWQLEKLMRLLRSLESDKDGMTPAEHQQFVSELNKLPALARVENAA